MLDPQISWYIVRNEDYELIDKEHYAGAYSPGNIEALFELQAWNNKWGTEDVLDVDIPVLVLMFNTIEDSRLLEYCKVKIDNGPFQAVEILGDKAIIPLNRPIAGTKNKGTTENINNYAKITIKFGPITHGMKNGLKSLLLDLQFNK